MDFNYTGGLGKSTMKTNEPVEAIIQWENDPASMPLNQWIRDLVVILGGIEGKQIHDAWTVLVRITEQLPDWNTRADVTFITEEAPWHLWEPGYCFKLWAGREVATVTIL